MSSSILTTFLGGLQASVSVLLTISYGVLAAQFQFLDMPTSKKISSLCVKLFLPALLIINLGSQLDISSGARYLPIFVWALVCNFTSMTLGGILVKVFKMPTWVTPAVTFNNAIAMPLLLTQSLQQTGVLDTILWGPNDTTSEAVTRAKSYFLFNAMIADALTFGIGPRLLGGPHDEDVPDAPTSDVDSDAATLAPSSSSDEESGPECAAQRSQQVTQDEEEIRVNEETLLLPNAVIRAGTKAKQKARRRSNRWWRRLHPRVQTVLDICMEFVSQPLIGAAIGVTIGLVPALKRAFFAETRDGGFLNAWFTSSIKNIGELFTSLQIVVVGVKLSNSLMAMKKGEESGHVPWFPFICVTVVRFILWPVISITAIYQLATKTNLLGNDPMLWFALMLMPAGPPALKLTSLADVSGVSDTERMSIAKFLVMSYIISPILAFTIVGALKASQAALQ